MWNREGELIIVCKVVYLFFTMLVEQASVLSVVNCFAWKYSHKHWRNNILSAKIFVSFDWPFFESRVSRQKFMWKSWRMWLSKLSSGDWRSDVFRQNLYHGIKLSTCSDSLCEIQFQSPIDTWGVVWRLGDQERRDRHDQIPRRGFHSRFFHGKLLLMDEMYLAPLSSMVQSVFSYLFGTKILH